MYPIPNENHNIFTGFILTTCKLKIIQITAYIALDNSNLSIIIRDREDLYLY